jgi:hypothetical protein
MLILIRCDSTSNKILLFYYCEITSLPLLCYMKQAKPDIIKRRVEYIKRGSEPYTQKQKTHSLFLLPEFYIFFPFLFSIFIKAR